MSCYCFSGQNKSGRDRFDDIDIIKSKRRSPIVMKLAHQLGIKDYLLKKFVFRNSASKYKIIQQADNNIFQEIQPCQTKIDKKIITKVEIIKDEKHSIPVVWLKNPVAKEGLTIVYSHGNSSDLSDSVRFMGQFIKNHPFNAIVYDYTGYGASKLSQINEETICQDLQLVLKWSKLPFNEIVLWGFSLGSFPTIDVASKYNFGGIILHSPIASIAHLLDSQSHDQQSYDVDCIDNLPKMKFIKSPVIIFHSNQDELIPFLHAQKLYQQLKTNRDDCQFSLVEVSDLGHNHMHQFFYEKKMNAINILLLKFLDKMQKKAQSVRKIWELETECEEQFTIIQSHQTVSINTHREYFKML